MDDRVQDWINGLAGHSGLADSLMKVASKDVVFLAVPLLLLLWFWPAPQPQRALNQRLAAATALGGVLALLLVVAAGALHSSVRPFVSDPTTRLLIAHAADNGFPSDHAAFAFGIAGTIVWQRWRLGLGLLALAGLVAFARVYVGVHWPSDVLAAALLGLLAGWIASRTVPLWSQPQRWASRLLPPLLLSPP